ncbi:hypothetical protein CVT25_005303 [Psilocybe cyanescens]|uniref:Uncharacterized protein n=1 Tax=Psilocybe cyanescens TaxID=93625 RepID=A0A409WX20_PSICY|nr:hypothetical protein CVT25_005303 [Psilocybe cyanescens]
MAAEQLSKTQSTRIMKELFKLLSIADAWDMPDSMKLIEPKIIFDYHLIENHPDKHKNNTNI